MCSKPTRGEILGGGGGGVRMKGEAVGGGQGEIGRGEGWSLLVKIFCLRFLNVWN